MSVVRLFAGASLIIGLALVPMQAAAASAAPKVKHQCNGGGVGWIPVYPLVNPFPRPCKAAVNVSTATTIYFDVFVPATNLPAGALDVNSITASLTWTGGGLPMLLTGQTWAAGFSGQVFSFYDGTGFSFYIRPDPGVLVGSRAYTVTISARTLDGVPIDTSTSSWTFDTRGAFASAQAFNVDTTAPTVHWGGRWFNGEVKVTFDASRLLHQEGVNALIDEARVNAPEFFQHIRDYPLLGSYWSFFVLDGDSNMVREIETRRITNFTQQGSSMVLSVTDMAEGPLYGIAAGRPLSGDYHVGDTVSVCDAIGSQPPEIATHCEHGTVQAVNDGAGTVTLSGLTVPAASWNAEPPVYPPDSPLVPDHFPYAYAALRKLSPAGTPVYYWTRLDDEFDNHVAHGRKPHVNLFGVPFDLCERAVGGGDGTGGACGNTPKDWLEWDTFVSALVNHLVDRYGSDVASWYFSIGNEQESQYAALIEYYDYTTNAILRTMEARLPMLASTVKVGGLEFTGLWPGTEKQFFYHASPSADAPSPLVVEEHNYVCTDPAFVGLRSSRVSSICAVGGANKGAPFDFYSLHSYFQAGSAASRVISARDNALSIDATYFNNLWINSHETCPDWVPETDPDAREMYRWGTFYSSWGADYFRRLLDKAATDSRYANGEAVVSTWSSNTNFTGINSIAADMHIDDNGDGVEDRVETVAVPFFRFAELAAHMSHDLAPLGTISDAGAVISGWRSVEPNADRILLYAHDPVDTGSREAGGWDVTLHLSHLRFPAVKITEYRIDRTHPARAALDAVGPPPPNGLYSSPAQIQAIADLQAADDLVPAGPPEYSRPNAGALDVTRHLYSQGVIFLDIQEEKCGNGTVDAGEQCDDGNFSSDDCCAGCLIAHEGLSCSDFNACTGGAGTPDHCAGGACVGGPCQLTTTCTVPQCGTPGTCKIESGTGLCKCLP